MPSFLLECNECGATQWIRGHVEDDGVVIDMDDDEEWEDGKEECEHEDFQIIDEEWEVFDDDVI